MSRHWFHHDLPLAYACQNQLSIKVKKMKKVKKVQVKEDLAYEIHSPFALVDAGRAPISRNLLHRYIEPVTDIVVKKPNLIIFS